MESSDCASVSSSCRLLDVMISVVSSAKVYIFEFGVVLIMSLM